jgi:hypothetical protein
MAYTGILLRGDTYDNIKNDPPIEREAVMAGEFIGVTTISGQTYYLNTAALALISEVAADGTTAAGFKTSDLPVTYDGGLIDASVDTAGITIDGSYLWRYSALANLEKADDLNFKIKSYEMITADLAFVCHKPTIDALSATAITVSWSYGEKSLVYNKTTSTALGEITSSGDSLTFGSSQTSGDVIQVWTEDADGNKSLQVQRTIS